MSKSKTLPQTWRDAQSRREARLEFHRSCEIVSSEQFRKALNHVKARWQRKSGRLAHVLPSMTVIIAMFHLCGCAPAISGEIRAGDAIRAIIGEASGEGSTGMLAVACAIRNRGTLKGVYGLTARRVGRQPEYVRRAARTAWTTSAGRDITRGATHWENTAAFGVPAWSRTMMVTTNIGKHTFYTERHN